MRKIHFTLLCLIYSLFINAQDFGGTLVPGIKPINRISTNKTNVAKVSEGPNTTLLTSSGPTGSSQEVGITEGALSVSLTGGANYNIPIAVPPGINGVVPQISLTYSSQSGNGMAGFGWNVTGVSSITRIASTKFHDGIIDGVDFDNLDRFAFNGQRLLLKNVSDVYGANGAIYETESFSNVKITSFGVHPAGTNYGPAYFLVEYPDGSLAYYGNSGDSRSLTEYAITYWENPQGVRISYSYSTSENFLYIDKIKYGTVGAVLAINELQFEYKTRLRPEEAYFGGQKIVNSKILSKIHVLGNGIGFRNYDLAHDATSLGYERLISLTERSGDNSLSYNPTIFSYEDPEQSISHSPVNASISMSDIASNNSASVSGDFDGDGKMDFVLYPTYGPDIKKKFWIFTDIIGESTNIGWEVPCGAFEEIFPSTWLSGNSKIMPYQGVTVVQNAPMQPYINNVNLNTYSALSYGVYLQHQRAVQFPDLLKREYLYGDFNGDGLSDVIAIDLDNPSTSSNTFFIDLDRSKVSNYMNFSGIIPTVSSELDVLKTGDFNGDGKTDIMYFDANALAKVYTLDGSNQITLLWSSNISYSRQVPLLQGDFNGDGKTDFLKPYYYDNSNVWIKYTSTGSDFLVESQTYPGLEFWQPYGIDIYHYISSDVNNDGKTDILYITASGDSPYRENCGLRIKTFINNNGVFSSQYGNYFSSSTNGWGIDKYVLPIFYSGNQANKNLEIAFIRGSEIHNYKFSKDFSKERLLRAITTGNGVKEGITYSSLEPANENQSDYDVAYKDSGYTENYPYSDVINSPSFQIVSQLEKVSNAVYKKQQFKYYGAVSNVEGLGFLGFRATMRTNWFDDNNTQIISSVSKNDMSFRGVNIENYSAMGIALPSSPTPSSSFISKNLNTYNMVNGVLENPLQLNKVYKLKCTFAQNFNGLDNTHSEIETIFDGYNNPTTSTTKLYNGNVLEQTTVGVLDYVPASTNPYVIGRPNKKTQTVTIYPGQGIPNEDTISSEEIYAYTNGLLTQIKKNVNATPYIFEDNDYDNFGNIKKKTLSAGALTPRVTRFEYDPSGRFLIKTYDTENLMTEFDFNQSSGVLNWEKNPYLLKTEFFYDKWLKKIKITDYLLKSKFYSYTRNNEKTLIITTADDNSSSTELFDDLGRKIKTGIKNIDDSWSYVDNVYDIYDRNIKVSQPYNTSPSQWTQTEYDDLGRIRKNTSFKGKIVLTTYSPLTTTIDDGLRTKKSIKNAIGNITSTINTPGGTIDYSYFANGSLKTSSYNGVVTSITLDSWGRKKELNDSSAGIYEYTYNDFGEILTEKTPKGITTYQINGVGKTDWKTIVGINGDNTNSKTTYGYDQTTKSLISTAYDDYSAGVHIDYVYTYDSSQRLIKTTEKNLQTADFERRTSYDSFGRPEREYYSAKNNFDGKLSDKWVKNIYKNGYHWKTLDDSSGDVTFGQVLWQTNSVNARGQLTSAALGNGIEIANTYDQYGFPTQFKHDKIGTTTVNVMKLNTVFDPLKGNLNSRINSLFNTNEPFKYDDFDRLTSWTKTPIITQNNTFTNGLDGFEAKPNASIANVTGKLKITASGITGAKKTIDTAAKKGEKFTISTTVSGAQYVGLSVIEINGQGDSLTFIKATVFRNGIPVIEHEMTQDASIIFVVEKTFIDIDDTSTTYFFIDNVVVTKTPIEQQVYDDTGRITQNTLGSYNYNDPNGKKYRNTSINLTPEALAYYNARPVQNIEYNAFKSPVRIEEEGVDIINYTYNASNGRSSMYYGSLDNDKLARPYRKYFSIDGSMEIKHNRLLNTVEFITYIGGDGYTAPVALKSDGAIKQYLYLHRDYQGSILAITNQAGAILEKRLFDPWGAIVKVQDGSGNILGGLTVLDRGYLGHEHLASVGLINMNARLYDPKLHRFLSPDKYVQDPSNTQSFNRYAYCWNNPLKYADYNGEWFGYDDLVVAAVSFAIGYVSSGIQTGQWGWSSVQSGLISAVVGWLAYNSAGASSGITAGSGALNAPMWNFLASSAATSAVSLMYPPVGIQIDNFTFSISPAIAFGNASGIGVNLSATYTNGDFSFSGGVGIMSNSDYNGLGKNGEEIRKSILASYDDGKNGVSLGTNVWSGDFAQRTGVVGLHFGDFNAMYENDGSIGGLGDGGDKFRTAALNLSVGEFTAGFNLMTGYRDYEGENGSVSQHRDPLCVDNYGRRMPNGLAKEDGAKYRLGALTFGYQGYRVGVNSEHVRHAIQDQAIHNLRIPWFNGKSLFDKRQMGFENQSWDWKGYSQFRSSNMFTSW